MLDIIKAGVHRGLKECQKLFRNDIWDCSFYNKNVTGKFPDFVQTTLPYGRNVVLYSTYHKQIYLLLKYFSATTGHETFFFWPIIRRVQNKNKIGVHVIFEPITVKAVRTLKQFTCLNSTFQRA